MSSFYTEHRVRRRGANLVQFIGTLALGRIENKYKLFTQ